MKNLIKQNKTIIAIIIGAIIISLGFIANTSMEQTRQDRKESKERVREIIKENSVKIAFDRCVEIARSDYDWDWENNCKLSGLKENCSLNSYTSESLEDRKNMSLETCLDIYKLEMK